MARDRTARARIRQLLATGGPISDTSGFATGLLKDRINYTGSSVAFIQLIAAMEEEGEIVREIRGKRTYKISATVETEKSFQPVSPPKSGSATRDTPGVHTGGSVEIDYEKLASALVRELWSVLSSVATASTAQANQVAAAPVEEDYLHKLAAAREALDDLFNTAEAKVHTSKV